MSRTLVRRLAAGISHANWRRLQARLARRRDAEYRRWVTEHDSPGPEQQAALQARVAAGPGATLALGWVLYGDEPDLEVWRRSVQSMQAQLHVHWQLRCVADAGMAPALEAWLADEPRARCVTGGTGDALLALQTPWVGCLAAGDVLPDHACSLLAEAATRAPAAQLVYADDDELDADGRRCNPHFKPDWNPELLWSWPSLGRPVLLRRERLVAALPTVTEGAGFEHGLLLAASLGLDGGAVVHVPHVLCHRAAAVSLADAATMQRLLRQHGVPACVRSDPLGGHALHLEPPAERPLVSVIVPTRDQLALLRTCIDSVRQRTAYAPLEIVVVDNGSNDAATLHWLSELAREPGVQVLRDDGPFNYAALNNAAVAQARGEYVLLLNNDTEVMQPEWLGEMLGLAALPGVGAVGARLWFDDRSLQHAGLVLGLDGVAGYAHRRLRAGAPGYQGRAHRLQAVSAVTAACLLVRKAAFLDVGGFDEAALAVAYNDVDLCLKLNRAGHRTLWTPQAQLFHYESRSRGSDAAPECAPRFRAEFDTMRARWGRLLDRDPAYNPNLALSKGAYTLAWPPRVSLARPWYDEA